MDNDQKGAAIAVSNMSERGRGEQASGFHEGVLR